MSWLWSSEKRNKDIIMNSSRRQYLAITSGVPQGAILGPLLFIVYINDLPRCVKHCSVNMYADNTVLFSNFITIGSGNEGSEDDDTQKVDDKSNTTVTTSSDANNHAASNFQPTEKPKLQMKRKSAGKNQDVANAEVQVLQSIWEKLGQKQTLDFKDEDELFGALIASQMRQIAPKWKVVAKLQISNIVYQEMLALFNSMPLSYTRGKGSWKYPQQQCKGCIRHNNISLNSSSIYSITASRIEWSGIRTKSHFRFLIC